MSRSDLHDFLVRNVPDLTPEREALITAVMNAGRLAGTRSVLFHTAIADRLGLNPSDHKCADLISSETEPVTAGRLAEITGLTSGAITGVVDRLERAGLVAREPDAEDRRRVLIRRTERTPIMRDLFMPMMEGMASLCATYTNEELELIAGFMHRSMLLSESLTQRLQQVELPLGPTETAQANASEKTGEKARKSSPGTRKR